MKNFALIAFASLASFSVSFATADDHMEMPVFGGVETFACDFVEGKGMDDLVKVTNKWDKWADKNHSVGYTGLVLSPFYYDNLDADFYWVGFSSSFKDQAVAQAEFQAKGSKMQDDFDSVYSCKSHSQLAWVRVRDETGPTDAGVVDFSGCAMLPNASREKLNAADKKMNSFLTQIGSSARVYRWYPMQGNEMSGADFYQANWSGSLEEKGVNTDKFLQSGGVQVRNSLYGSIMQCNGGPSANYVSVGGSEG
jgi:hypothetical protein|tara:strand:+ start:822 stop:1577 length:756 start_codon:yes stop_codon:yes gene_type:complete